MHKQSMIAGQQPMAFVPKEGPLFAFAGLCENWRDRAAGDSAESIRTCAIVTGEPNEVAATIHDRMPVILPVSAWAADGPRPRHSPARSTSPPPPGCETAPEHWARRCARRTALWMQWAALERIVAD
jgi:hypothetical protein